MELGNAKVLNIIMLGAYIGYTKVLPETIVLDTIKKQLGKRPAVIPLNCEAFERGLQIGKDLL